METKETAGQTQGNETKHWTMVKINTLNPGEHFVIRAGELPTHENNFRSRVSRINRECNSNIKVHKERNGDLWVWFDPAQRAKVSDKGVLLDKLLDLQRKKRELETIGTIDAYTQLEPVERDIAAVLADMRQPIKRGFKGSPGALHCPLEMVLDHIGITKEIWDYLEPSEKTRRRIKAEIELKRIREQQQQATDQSNN